MCAVLVLSGFVLFSQYKQNEKEDDLSYAKYSSYTQYILLYAGNVLFPPYCAANKIHVCMKSYNRLLRIALR